MKIGDEVYVHGYVDEMRNDVIIIRNDGGYFGTSDREMFYYEEDERGYGTMNEADRKTEPTISKMEQVEEPQKWTKENCKGCKYNEYPYDSGTCFVRVCINGNKYEPKDEPQTDCDHRCVQTEIGCEKPDCMWK